MFVNYLVTALRNLARHRLSAIINIGGLAVGLACVILIALFIRDELSFDKWVPDSANLYRVEELFNLPGRPPLPAAVSDFPLAPLLKDNLPQVTAIAHFWPRPRTITTAGRSFSQDIVEVDPDFFRVIRFPLLSGDPATVLSRPDAVVVSRALALKLFGTANAVGRTLAANKVDCPYGTSISCDNGAVQLRVAGVMEDLPHNTQLKADAVISYTSTADTLGEEGRKHYYSVNGWSYVRLAPGADPATVLARVPQLLDRHVNVLEDLGMKLQASKTIEVQFKPFTQVHLSSDGMLGNMVPPGSRTLLYGLGAIGFLILLVGCFNFTNLATARALSRAREIALRKCAGARRSQIIVQFLGESVLTALLALVLALALVEMLLPGFDRFLDRPLTFHYLADWQLLALIAAIAAAAGLVGGAYPALVLSRFLPAPVLRANSAGHAGSSRLRATLVVLQFAVAIGLAVAALVVSAQIDFMRNQALGFRRDNILLVDTNRRMSDTARKSFIEEMRRIPGVQDVALSSDHPFSGSVLVAQMKLPGHDEYITLDRQVITPDFFRLYGVKLLAGRMLSRDRSTDKGNWSPFDNDGRNILVNRAAAARLGFTVESAVGKMVLLGPSHVTIAGVVDDMRIDGARSAARPIIYIVAEEVSPLVSLRLAGGQIPQTVNAIDRTWRRFAPNVAIDRHFLDEDFDKLYSDDVRQGEMFSAFVAIAIVIACLGLFGLAAFTARRRTKEIGIRKVFGARTADLARMLLWQFSLPVLLANLIAWPLAWYYLDHWLQGFAYRISLSPLYFAAAGLAALLIAWATVFGHALRVARANPINALRYE